MTLHGTPRFTTQVFLNRPMRKKWGRDRIHDGYCDIRLYWAGPLFMQRIRKDRS